MLKKTICFLASALLLYSCDPAGMRGDNAPGDLLLSLDTSDEVIDVRPTKSEDLGLDVNDFNVEIFNSSQVRIFSKTYREINGSPIPLNAGKYTLLASYGDSLAAGFSAIYFAAKEPFEIYPQNSSELSAVCRQANVKLAVVFGEYMLSEHPDVYARIVRDSKRQVTFQAGEKRHGYIPSGDLTMEVYAKIDGKLMMYKAEPLYCRPGDFVTFNVDLSASGDASLNVGVTIDSETEDKEYNITIPASSMPDEAPSVSVKGFESGNVIAMDEGSSVNGSIEISVPAGIESCRLEISSEALVTAGFPESVDLVAGDPEDIALLESYGMFFSKKSAGQIFAYVNFDTFTRNIPFVDGASSNESLFRLYVRDTKGREAQSDYVGFSLTPISIQVEPVAEGDIWATSVKGINVGISSEDVPVVLQYMKEGDWVTLENKPSYENGKVHFDEVSSLQPDTEYSFRAVYNGNIWNPSDPVTIRTEAAQQLPNSGFEDITRETLEVSLWFGQKDSRPIYYPYAQNGEHFWAVNSRRTMPSSTTPLHINFKCTPTVFPTTAAHSGNSAMQVATISVNDMNTDMTSFGTPVAGELFVGEADNGGGHSSEGRSFASRPSSMAFYYKFTPYDSESFYAYVELRSAGGNVIGSGVIDNMNVVKNQWERVECPIEYTDMSQKAASIYVIFKSSASSSPAAAKNVSLEMDGNMTSAHLGSLLAVDDIELIY